MDRFLVRKRKEEADTDSDNSPEAKRRPMCIRHIARKNLNLDYCILYGKSVADSMFQTLNSNLKFFSGKEAKVKLFGNWVDIPRRHVAFGDCGLSYTFSGNTIHAKPWNDLPLLEKIKSDIENHLHDNVKFNFVLVNYYKDGNDYIGEHRDDEKELAKGSPIASLSLGQERDFVFRHKDNRRNSNCATGLEPVKFNLQHGSLLVMNAPTNQFWYHCLPKRKKLINPRLNLTFRVMHEPKVT